MKEKNKAVKRKWPFLMALMLIVMSSVSVAQDLDLDYDLGLDLDDDALDYEPLDVDGVLSKRKKKSAADRLADMREKLEERNQDLMHKKMEDIRIQEEKKMTKRLRNMFDGVANPAQEVAAQDTVTTQQAAPVSAQEIPQEISDNTDEKIKLEPFMGMNTVSGQNFNYESSVLAGINVESEASSRWAFGGGLSYSRMDFAQRDVFPYNPYYTGPYNDPFYTSRYGGYGNRDITSNHWKIDIYSKFYLVKSHRFKPYIGGGLGFNRSSLKYQKRESYYYSSGDYYFGEEEFTTNYISGSAFVGTEFSFSSSVGVNLQAKYSRGFTSGIDNSSPAGYGSNPDQSNLEQLGNQINDADLFSVTAGLVVTF